MKYKELTSRQIKAYTKDGLAFKRNALFNNISPDNELILSNNRSLEWGFYGYEQVKQYAILIQNLGDKKWTGVIVTSADQTNSLELPTLSEMAPGEYRFWILADMGKEIESTGPYAFTIAEDSDENKKILTLQTKAKKQRRFLDDKINKIKKHIANGDSVLSTSPWQLTIGLYGRGCNINCNMCGFPTEIYPDSEIINKYYHDTMTQLSPRIHEFKSINTSGGEPLQYKELHYIINATTQWPETQFSMCTNGYYMSNTWVNLLGKQKLGRISFSLDAATEETYNKIRTGSNWPNVIKGIKQIVSIRGANRNPLIFLNFIVFRHNFHEMTSFVDLAHELSANGVVFQFPNNASQLGFVGSVPDRAQLKMEWINKSSYYDDESICKSVIHNLAEATNKMKEYSMIISHTNVKHSIGRFFPHLIPDEFANQTSSDTLDESFDTGAGQQKFVEPKKLAAPAFKQDDFGLNPRQITFSGSAYISFILKDRDIPDNMGHTYWDTKYSHFVDIPDDLPNGEYEALLVWPTPGGFGNSERCSFVLEDEKRLSPLEYVKKYKGQQNKTTCSKWLSKTFTQKLIKDDSNEFIDPIGPENTNTERYFCTAPFTNLTLRPSSAAFCCHARKRYRSIPLPSHDLDEIWNSPIFREARYYMLLGKGREKVCSPRCPHYQTGFIHCILR